MRSSSLIALFSESSRANLYPSTFAISMLTHGALFSLLTFSVLHNHRILERFPENHYSMRVLDFRSVESVKSLPRQAAGGGIIYHNPQATPRKQARARSSGSSPALSWQTAQLAPAPQTLLQSDLPKEVIVSPQISVLLAALRIPDKIAPSSPGLESAGQPEDQPGNQPGNQIAGSGPTQTNAASGPARGGAAGFGNSSSPVHISMPRDGQFGVVVFGSSIADKYPETAEMWSGRLASTVYLRVGLPKSWILQYALPRIVDATANLGGHLDAPWPYEIVRPNIDPGELDADALILHGFVNNDGRFEKLEVVFPPEFVQSPTVLDILNQWQFRPAKLNGAMTVAEILLIIPGQSQQ
jgi:hypothetical protein